MYSFCLRIIPENKFSYQQFVRFASALRRVSADLDEEVAKNIEENGLKPRKHPGILPSGPFVLPNDVKTAMSNLLTGIVGKQTLTESVKFKNYLFARGLPKGPQTISKIKSAIEEEVDKLAKKKPDEMNEEEFKRFRAFKEAEVNKRMKQQIYNWKRLDFTTYLGLLYCTTRSAAEYSAISKIFSEILVRTSMEPKTIFDYGSGLGSVIWAANEIWRNSISEYYCVDSSGHMNELSEQIINYYKDETLRKKIFYRQFLPSSNEVTSDIVISAYSLMEQPSSSARLEVIENLWNRTRKFLVLIEVGSQAGFKIINEARTFILKKRLENEDAEDAHVFAPCPHDLPCPRTSTPNICYFESRYLCFPQKPEIPKKEFFCYVVLEKGPRNENDKNWPRIVQPVLQRSGHTVCRFCTSTGHLEEVVFSPSKQGRIPHRCAKKSNWGDLFPCRLKNVEKKSVSKDKTADEN